MGINTVNEVVRLKLQMKAAGYSKKGRPPRFSAAQFYPRALENDLSDALKNELMRINAEMIEAATVGIMDDIGDLNAAPVVLSSGFLDRSRQIGERIADNAGQNFSKQVDMIVGRPYYPPGQQPAILNAWHDEFQTLCVSAGQDGKKAIAALTAIGKEKGWNKNQLENEIEKVLPIQTKHRAELIARTETAKLNSRCTLATYQQVGIKYYKWLTTIDGRERESHAEMNGKICSVEDPEVYFTENEANPLHPVRHERTGAMYHGHPGTDFQCRCSMVMWDPEIDGQYEVKEDQRRAEIEAQKQAEKEAEAQAEAEAKAKAEAEEKKRQEALEREKKKAEQARQAEAEAKKKAEAEAKAREEAERRAQILQKANERHARRTPEQVEKIREKWLAKHGEFNFITPNPDLDGLNDVLDITDYIKKTHKIKIEGNFKNCDPVLVKQAFKGFDDLLRVFPAMTSEIEKIEKVTGKDYIMCAGFGTYRATGKETPFFLEMCHTYIKKDNPRKIGASGLHRNATAYSSTTHELGHVLNYWIKRKTTGRAANYESMAMQWVKEEAEKMAGRSLRFSEVLEMRKTISLYADSYQMYTETIAESVADVFQNRENAQEFSKAIFRRVKKEYEAAAKI